jgi:hypothetical protein
MDPKRKRIYIIVIILCFTLSAGLLLWSNFSGGGGGDVVDHSITQIPGSNTSAQTAVADPITGFVIPRVFPNISTFDTDVLKSEDFIELEEYPKLDVTGQLGRPDPFRSY